MANVRATIVAQNREAVIDALKEAGSLTYRELATATDLTYGSVRGIIASLMEDGTTGARRGAGKTLYFYLKGGSTIPKLMGGKGFVPFTQVVRASLERKIFSYDFNAAIAEVFALIYSQPAIAAVEGSVGADTHDFRMIQHRLADIKEMLDNISRVIAEIEGKLLPSNLTKGWQAWADDDNYDLELAVTARAKHAEHSAALIEAYKMLMAERNPGGLSHVQAIADTVDES